MLDDKIKLEQYFEEEIKRVSDIEIAGIEQEIDEIRKKSMEGLELEAQREAGLTREQELKEMASEHAIRLSKAHEETNRRLMKKRRELTDAVFRAAKQQLKEFAIRKDYVELLKKKASDLFNRKIDICIDTIGSNQTITQCLDYIKETGTIAVYGLKSGENLDVPLPELRNFNIQYIQWPVPEVEAEVHKPVCDAIMDGKIDIDLFVTHRFSIDDYEKGFQAVKDRTALKVVLNF